MEIGDIFYDIYDDEIGINVLISKEGDEYMLAWYTEGNNCISFAEGYDELSGTEIEDYKLSDTYKEELLSKMITCRDIDKVDDCFPAFERWKRSVKLKHIKC